MTHRCPNCGAAVDAAASDCARCAASFADPQGWKPVPAFDGAANSSAPLLGQAPGRWLRSATYWLGFLLVAQGSLLEHFHLVLRRLGIVLGAGGYLPLPWMFMSFGQLLPMDTRLRAPALSGVVDFVLLVLVLRRIRLLVAGRETPRSFAGVASVPGYLGAGFLVASALAFAAAMASREGSGVPAGLLLLPALLLVPWSFVLTEAMELRLAGPGPTGRSPSLLGSALIAAAVEMAIIEVAGSFRIREMPGDGLGRWQVVRFHPPAMLSVHVDWPQVAGGLVAGLVTLCFAIHVVRRGRSPRTGNAWEATDIDPGRSSA